MKLSADPKHRDYHPELVKSAQVILNGKLITGLCTYADEESGFVDLIHTDSRGKIMTLNDRLLTNRIFGEVHVRP